MQYKSLEQLLARPLVFEDTLEPHNLDVNPEAGMFRTTAPGATEIEYLNLLSALVGIFKPTCILETGTLGGDGTIALMHSAAPGTIVLTVGAEEPSPIDVERLRSVASEQVIRLIRFRTNTSALIAQGDTRLKNATNGNLTFAFLDTRIPDRPAEFAFITNPLNHIMNFSRPCCVCIHDFSRHRPSHAHDADRQAPAALQIEACADSNGWQRLRLHQSRGMYVLCHYP